MPFGIIMKIPNSSWEALPCGMMIKDLSSAKEVDCTVAKLQNSPPRSPNAMRQSLKDDVKILNLQGGPLLAETMKL